MYKEKCGGTHCLTFTNASIVTGQTLTESRISFQNADTTIGTLKFITQVLLNWGCGGGGVVDKLACIIDID